MRNFLKLFILSVAVSLVGCGAGIPTIKPYKMDIQQGNVVTSEMLLKLRPGMTKSQVKFIMGTPLLVDSFHSNRWDYFYQLRKQGEIVSQRRVILDFEDNLLTQVRGDVVPKGQTAEDVAKQLTDEASESEKPDESASDTVEPIVVPIEEPDVEAADAASEAAESSLLPMAVPEVGEQASVLAVPIPLGPSESVLDEPVLTEEVPATEVVEEVSPAIEEAASSKEISAMPVEKVLPISTFKDKKLVFRLDRKLDMSRIKADGVSASDEVLQESVVQAVEESQNDALLNQEEPSFFERMLEKIGF